MARGEGRVQSIQKFSYLKECTFLSNEVEKSTKVFSRQGLFVLESAKPKSKSYKYFFFNSLK